MATAFAKDVGRAIFHDNIALVEYYLKQGFNPNEILNDEVIPIQTVRSVEMLKLLMKYGADINKPTSNGLTFLQNYF